MKRPRKSNRVSWAHGSNLCQVRLYLSEDCPSQVGNDGQDGLKTKSTNLQHYKSKDFNEPPPGFERPTKSFKPNSSHFATIHWNCPPKFGLSFDWNVVAGEESQEVNVQKLRVSQVLEALYPSPAVIPANSYVSSDVDCEFYDDNLTPTIPIIPIEEEEDTTDVPPTFPELEPKTSISVPSSMNSTPTVSPSSIPSSAKCNAPAKKRKPEPGMSLDQGTCLITAAAVALMKSEEQRSMVDTDLLVKILSDPKMVAKLASGFHNPTISADEQTVAPKPATHLAPPSVSNPAPSSAPFPPVRNSDYPRRDSHSPPTTPWPKPAIAAERDAARVSVANPTAGNLISAANQVITNLKTPPSLEKTGTNHFGTEPNPYTGSGLMSNQAKTISQTWISSVKDTGYFKNLIREHGTDKARLIREHGIDKSRLIREHGIDKGQDRVLSNNMMAREVDPKFQRPCIYFNTPRGCWNGIDCPYQHDNLYWTEPSPLKRMRLSGEVNW